MGMRVVLAMSGGVDSSTSAYLLKQQGYEVIGLFMRSGATEETVCATNSVPDAGSDRETYAPSLPVLSGKSHKQGCCSAADAADARRVADRLDIPFYALNFRDAFGRIQDYFADEYLAGRTPNPCVMCNNWLKFGKLWEFACQVGAERIATGHYARIGSGAERPRFWDGELGAVAGSCPLDPGLFRGRDRSKDQSYVLFGIDRSLLDRILFPVGESTKAEIREFAHHAGLRVADKRDSQEICFIPNQDYAGFVRRHRGEHETAGELVDTAGNVVGHHGGYENFTIGQRKGLGVTFGAPRYVVAIQAETKRVVIGTRDDLARQELEADCLNWLVDDVPTRFTCTAQIRYQHPGAQADVRRLDENLMQVRFKEPQYGIAPGQAVVLYDGDRVLGGGWIR